MENEDNSCLIKATKRLRVKGNDPRRKELVPFSHIGMLPDEYVAQLLEIPKTVTGNDLGSDNYQISQHCNLEEVFNTNNGASYRQILLQSKIADSSDIDECAYTEWNRDIEEQTKAILKDIFGEIYRFRISEMRGNHELNWHIDTDTSVLCRAQICLQQTDATFEVKDKSGTHILRMQKGGIYFINTGWLHRVVNSSDNVRTVAIFGFRFHTLQKHLQDKIRI
jgi:hypothetical protein